MEDNRMVVKIDPDLEDLIPGFMENRRKDIASILDALERGDFETVRSLGHSLKGVGGGYGFHVVSEMGALMENAARGGDEAAIRRHVDSLSLYLDGVQLEFG